MPSCLTASLPLGETRTLLAKKYAIFNEQSGEGLDQVGGISSQLSDMEAELNSNLPMSDTETAALFSKIQEHLYGLHTAVRAAPHTLIEAMN